MVIANKKQNVLKFFKGNAKLPKSIYTFSLPSGWTCVGAKECLSRANKETGKIKDGPNTKFRCFSASQESLYPSVRKARWHNLKLLSKAKSVTKMVELIGKSLPTKAKTIRVHPSGDFFNQNYFDSWLEIAKKNPDKLFYAYTKSLPFWLKRKEEIPNNLKLVASEGGKYDDLIKKFGLRYAKVVFSEQEAKDLRLEIDHDDSLAYGTNKSFGLILHGIQPLGSVAAKALSTLKQNGFTGYSRKIPLKTVNGANDETII